MWVCKECGEKNNFSEEIIGGTQRIEINKYGEIEDYWDLYLKTGYIICNNCSNEGNFIDEIADWIEDEES